MPPVFYLEIQYTIKLCTVFFKKRGISPCFYRITFHNCFLHIMYPRSARFAKAGFLPRSSVSYLDWGICANGNVLTARLTFPKLDGACSLSDILIPDVPEKYYLSREKAEKLFPNSQIISLRESESTTQAEQP